MLITIATISLVRVDARADEMRYKEILREDFSLFTAGSEERPSANTVNDNLQYIPDSKTLTPGWQGVEIYQAGGVAYQGAGGRLFTPNIDLSKNGGTFRVSFRMRLASGSPEGNVNVVHNSNIYNYIGEALTEEWKTYTVELENGIRDDFLCIRGVDYQSPSSSKVRVFIDDIVVEVPDPAVATPSRVTYGNFDGTAFSVSWSRVADADRYELRLYYLDKKGENVYIDGDYVTTSTSYSFSGLEERWNEYYVQVRALAGSEVSPWSTPLLVEGLSSPVLKEETGVSDSGFTASWTGVKGAVSYELMAYYCHEAKGDEECYHANTDFSFVEEKDADAGQIDYGFEEMPGWFFGAADLQDGYIGVQGAFAYLGYAAQIESPALDLSSSGGKVSVEFKAKNDDLRTGVAVALYNPQDGDFVLADSYEYELSKNWSTVTASLKGGTDGSILALIPTRSGNIYIDDLKVWQNIKAGAEGRVLADKITTTATNAAVRNLDIPQGDYAGYKVRAIGISADRTRWLYSTYSDMRYPMGKSGDAGVSSIVDASMEARYYDVNGIEVKNPQPGMLLIKVEAGKASKTLLK